jgi:alpha-mannosidase
MRGPASPDPIWSLSMKSILAAAGLAVLITAALAGAQPDSHAGTQAKDKAPGTDSQGELSESARRGTAGHPGLDITKDPTLFVVGYAHLDTQWRWTYIDTIREFIPDTLHDNFKLFEKYPDYVFNFSGSRRYRMMQEYYPEDYARLKGYVAAGRWFPCGSSVDENDANVPSAESLVRHVLYGNRFFMHEFGLASQEYMLPDCFGFPAALPSVLAHCGVKGFSTQKLTWNACVPIPFKVGVWEGPDGHSVIAALDPGAYVGDVKTNLANDQSWLARIQNNGKQSGVFADYHYFGTGDQGGAPHDATVAKVEESAKTDGAIRVVSGPADAMVKAITPEMAKGLPRYKGELELTEHSAGSITSEAYMKRWNRKNELLADAAERASVAAWWMGGREYPAQQLENAWYLVLGSQMHDILPGTSVPRAYDLSWNDECIAANQFSGILEDAAGSVISGMDTRSSGEHSTTVVVYNPLSFEREDIVEALVPVPFGQYNPPVGGVGVVNSATGQPVPAQILERVGPNLRIAFLARVPSVGFTNFEVLPSVGPQPSTATQLKVGEHELENETYAVKLNAKGDVSSIVDKRTGKEMLDEPARIGLFYENPQNWPAWNQDWADRRRPAMSFVGLEGHVSFKVVESGPARVAVEITRSAEGSTFTQRIRLCAGEAGKRVEFDTDIDWRTRERSVRAAFPLTVSNPNATYDIQTGTITRGNGHDKQFEYAFHQWFDLSDAQGGPGLTVMCDSKYGADKPNDNTVRLTLLHTPGTRGGYPDQGSQDLGRHHVLYALAAHAGTWQADRTYTQAQQVNQPLRAFTATPHEGPLGKAFSLASSSDPAVTISAMKRAEDGDEVIVRLREHTGAAAKGVRIALGDKAIVAAREVDGQERQIGQARVENGWLVTDVGGYELRAFALKLGEAPTKLARIESNPVELPYDTDAVSTRANRADGAMDDQGNSLPAEQFPPTLTDGSVSFVFGKTSDGQKNALTCQGQQIALPPGSWDRLYLLACANGDVPATLDVNGKPTAFTAQNWTGYVGQWDHRLWPGNSTDSRYPWNRDIVGLEPGFVKPAPIAWYCSHHNTKGGDAFYEYSYIFRYAFDLPEGSRNIRLPNDSRIKIFAASVARIGKARSWAAAPLFDTLADHVQDAPRITPGEGKYDDTIAVKLDPSLYWKQGAIHFTSDGSDPTASSTTYDQPIWVMEPTTLKAAVVDAQGHMGPVATARLEVNDRKGPAFEQQIGFGYQSTKLELTFRELIDAQSAYPSNFRLDPPIEIKNVSVAHDGYHVTLFLASPPSVEQIYKLTVSGIKDYSPNHNPMEKPQTTIFQVHGPVYSLDTVTPEQINKPIEVKGLPVKARDNWTLNMFVKTAKQPAPRTVIAGFGQCEQAGGGNGRYLCRFPGGLHFWSHNQDAPSRTPLDLDKWQMLTATYDGQTLRLFKNGEQVGERGVGLADDQNVVMIAPKDPWDHERQFEGEIKGFTIWSSALSADAVHGLLVAMPK